MGCYSIFKVVVAIGTLLGKGNYKITDRYSANGVGVVLYYHYPIMIVFGCNFVASIGFRLFLGYAVFSVWCSSYYHGFYGLPGF